MGEKKISNYESPGASTPLTASLYYFHCSNHVSRHEIAFSHLKLKMKSPVSPPPPSPPPLPPHTSPTLAGLFRRAEKDEFESNWKRASREKEEGVAGGHMDGNLPCFGSGASGDEQMLNTLKGRKTSMAASLPDGSPGYLPPGIHSPCVVFFHIESQLVLCDQLNTRGVTVLTSKARS